MLNNFLGQFLEKLKQFLGQGSKMDCFFKKGVIPDSLYQARGSCFLLQRFQIFNKINPTCFGLQYTFRIYNIQVSFSSDKLR